MPPTRKVYEDPTEGYQCAGLASRPARSAVELRTHFNAGRTARDATVRRDAAGNESGREGRRLDLPLGLRKEARTQTAFRKPAATNPR